MEFLLILSAMLSAVTGAFSGVREAQAHVQRTEATASAASAAAAEAATAMAGPAIPKPEAPTSEVAPLPRFAPIVAAPLDEVRLIE